MSATIAAQPITPRRKDKLPTTSPPSARLRRLAPGPVKIPPTPPLNITPPNARQLSTSVSVPLIVPGPLASVVGETRDSLSIPSADTIRQTTSVFSGLFRSRHGSTATGTISRSGSSAWTRTSRNDSSFTTGTTITRGTTSTHSSFSAPEAIHDEDPFVFDRCQPLQVDIGEGRLLGRLLDHCQAALGAITRVGSTSGGAESPRGTRTMDEREEDRMEHLLESPIRRPSGAGPSFPSDGPLVRRDSEASDDGFPLFLDRGTPSTATLKRTRSRTVRDSPDVPNDVADPFMAAGPSVGLTPQGASRAGDALLSPRAYLATCVPRPVLIQFRDVFGANDTTAPHLPVQRYPPLPAALPVQRYLPPPEPPSQPPRELSLAESFATFEFPRQQSTHAEVEVDGTGEMGEMGEGGDAGSGSEFSFSAYLLDRSAPSSTTHSRHTTAAFQVEEGDSAPRPRLNFVPSPPNESPMSVADTELVTPEHPASPRFGAGLVTDRHTSGRVSGLGIEVGSDTPTPKPSAGAGWMERTIRAPGRARDREVSKGTREPAPVFPLNSRRAGSENASEADAPGKRVPAPVPRGPPRSARDATFDGRVSTGKPVQRPQSVIDVPVRNGEAQNWWRDSRENADSLVAEAIRAAETSEDAQPGEEEVSSQTSRGEAEPLSRSARAPCPPRPGTTSLSPMDTRLGRRVPVPSAEGLPVDQAPRIPVSRSAAADLSEAPREANGSQFSTQPSNGFSKSRIIAPPERLLQHRADSPPPSALSVQTKASQKSKSSHVSGRSTQSGVSGLSAKSGISKASHASKVTQRTQTSLASGFSRISRATFSRHGRDLDPDVQQEIDAMLDTFDKRTTMSLWVDQVTSTLSFVRYNPPTDSRLYQLDALDSALSGTDEFADDVHLDQGHPYAGKMSNARSKDEGVVSNEPFLRHGCLQFGMNPRERDRWNFHSSALEAYPCIRRLTLNSADNYDYLPRTAALKIRDPGVYTVTGHEEKHGIRVEWKFEYMVDLKTKQSGEVIPAERIVIPLAFYVSPNFFSVCAPTKLSIASRLAKSLRPAVGAMKIPTPPLGEDADKVDDPLVPPSPPSGPLAKAAEAIVNVFRPTTPAKTGKVPKFGSKTPIRGRGKTPTRSAKEEDVEVPPVPSIPISHSGSIISLVESRSSSRPSSIGQTEEGFIPPLEDGKKKIRFRAATLFSRRPFTPTASAISEEPVPKPFAASTRPKRLVRPSTSTLDISRPFDMVHRPGLSEGGATLTASTSQILAPSMGSGTPGRPAFGRPHTATSTSGYERFQPPLSAPLRPVFAGETTTLAPRSHGLSPRPQTARPSNSLHPFATSISPVRPEHPGAHNLRSGDAPVSACSDTFHSARPHTSGSQQSFTPLRPPRPATSLRPQTSSASLYPPSVTPNPALGSSRFPSPSHVVQGYEVVITPHTLAHRAPSGSRSESEDRPEVIASAPRGLTPAPNRGMGGRRPNTADPRMGGMGGRI